MVQITEVLSEVGHRKGSIFAKQSDNSLTLSCLSVRALGALWFK